MYRTYMMKDGSWSYGAVLTNNMNYSDSYQTLWWFQVWSQIKFSFRQTSCSSNLIHCQILCLGTRLLQFNRYHARSIWILHLLGSHRLGPFFLHFNRFSSLKSHRSFNLGLYLVKHPYVLSLLHAFILFVAGLICLYLNYAADEQRLR